MGTTKKLSLSWWQHELSPTFFHSHILSSSHSLCLCILIFLHPLLIHPLEGLSRKFAQLSFVLGAAHEFVQSPLAWLECCWACHLIHPPKPLAAPSTIVLPTGVLGQWVNHKQSSSLNADEWLYMIHYHNLHFIKHWTSCLCYLHSTENATTQI